MLTIKEFEKEALKVLTSDVLSLAELEAVIEGPDSVSYEQTGSGYYLTLEHRSLPEKRIVCSKPVVKGVSGDIQCGFVVFVEDRRLTLECHSWGEKPLPGNFRDGAVTVATE